MINWNTISGKKVFLRADLNVPLIHGTIVDDHRLQAIVPTINHIQQHGGMIILATHIGRPAGNDQTLSTRHLVPWFEQHNYTIVFQPDLERIKEQPYQANTILLMENLRFYSQEQKPTAEFAQQLANTVDFYLNDAFAVLHRNDCSITLVPKLFDDHHKDFGPLVKKELHKLNTLLKQPKKGFLVVLGGGKVSTKLPLLMALLHKADTIMLCPAMVFTFLKALGKPVGTSLVEDSMLNDVQHCMQEARNNNTTLLFPLDYYTALDTIDGPLKIVSADAIPDNGIGISIGPVTIKAWQPYSQQANALFINAGMGFLQRPETTHYTQEFFAMLAQSPGYSVVGGGESVSIVRLAHLEHDFDFISTGGGATLTYVSGQPMPGLEAMKEKLPKI